MIARLRHRLAHRFDLWSGYVVSWRDFRGRVMVGLYCPDCRRTFFVAPAWCQHDAAR
jgi:hypothetical protein